MAAIVRPEPAGSGRCEPVRQASRPTRASSPRRSGPRRSPGFFCGGEIGPVGGKAFLQGVTATLAVFLEP
jgi:hypothetical protein